MKIDHNISDLKEIIQTNNTNGTINCNIDELLHNLYNCIGNFGTNIWKRFLQGSFDTKKRNTYSQSGTNLSQQRDTSNSKKTVIMIDKIVPKVKDKVTSVFEILKRI